MLRLLLQTSSASNLPKSELRWELAGIVVGAILLAIGLLALSVFFSRKRIGDRTLIYFGIFTVIYAVRLLVTQPIVLSALDISPTAAIKIRWAGTFILPIPFLLYLLQIIEERLRTVFRWAVGIQSVIAAFGILGVALDAERITGAMANVTDVLVIAFWVVMTVYDLLFRRQRGPRPRETRVFTVGLIIFGLFVLYGNLSDLKLLPGRHLEPLGFLIFAGCLGYVAAYRTFANEERLLAIHKELEIAQQIQSSILPSEIPSVTGLEIAARYAPMGAVAGDFYDFLVPTDAAGKRIGIFIADVTGHGVPAALIASMLKVALAAQTAHAADPAQVLSNVNRMLCGKFQEQFVTAAYLFVDVEREVFRYAGAGHPPLFLARGSDGAAREIEQNGLMLGLFPDAQYSAVEFPAEPGDRFLLYTDGVLEASNSSLEEFGKARCKQFLESGRVLGANRFADALLQELSRWSGNRPGRPQDDDITLLIVDFKNPAS